MSNRLTEEEAKRILADCSPEQCFWVNNGPVLHNINELSATLDSLSKEQFTHHVNKEKNDFSKWIDEVLKDKQLAKELSKLSSKPATAKAIGQRVEILKKIAG